MQHHLNPSINRLQTRPKRVRKVLASVSINSLASLTTFLNGITTHVHDFQQSGPGSSLTQISAVWTQKLSGESQFTEGSVGILRDPARGLRAVYICRHFTESIFGLNIFSPYKVSLLRKNSPRWKFPKFCSLGLDFCGRNVFFVKFHVPLSEIQAQRAEFWEFPSRTIFSA